MDSKWINNKLEIGFLTLINKKIKIGGYYHLSMKQMNGKEGLEVLKKKKKDLELKGS